MAYAFYNTETTGALIPRHLPPKGRAPNSLYNAVNFPNVDVPAFPLEQDMDASVAVADPHFADLAVTLRDGSLVGAA